MHLEILRTDLAKLQNYEHYQYHFLFISDTLQLVYLQCMSKLTAAVSLQKDIQYNVFVIVLYIVFRRLLLLHIIVLISCNLFLELN